MYLSSMMSDLYEYMQECAEEDYEDEYDPEGKFGYNCWIGEEYVVSNQPQ